MLIYLKESRTHPLENTNTPAPLKMRHKLKRRNSTTSLILGWKYFRNS